jgi:hypothetical protein
MLGPGRPSTPGMRGGWLTTLEVRRAGFCPLQSMFLPVATLFRSSDLDEPHPEDLFAAPESDPAAALVTIALFCEDIFGARYRFPIVDLGEDLAPYPGERHRLGEKDCPDWVTSGYLSWPHVAG